MTTSSESTEGILPSETNDITIYLEPSPARMRALWLIYACVSVLWIIQGYVALDTHADGANQSFAYFQVIVGGLLMAAALWFVFRTSADRMRVSVTESGVEVKDSATAQPRVVAWDGIVSVRTGINSVSLIDRNGAEFRVNLAGSYRGNQEIKEALGRIAQARGIEMTDV